MNAKGVLPVICVLTKKEKSVPREIHKQNSQRKMIKVDLNKVNKGPLFQLISSTRRQTVSEMLVSRPPEGGTVNALRGLITAFVCKYVFKCVCPYGGGLMKEPGPASR